MKNQATCFTCNFVSLRNGAKYEFSDCVLSTHLSHSLYSQLDEASKRLTSNNQILNLYIDCDKENNPENRQSLFSIINNDSSQKDEPLFLAEFHLHTHYNLELLRPFTKNDGKDYVYTIMINNAMLSGNFTDNINVCNMEIIASSIQIAEVPDESLD